ncbi:NAD(P)/FAD-dependent oxidoreductase [Marinospirillum insulare]|uniref:Twin-arginine translocation pathway signal n=1 Tax=Marinospirillum insulare TaxID=217169 RepID=A0ABQ5ZT55_9GAMM|nr:FAD-dependent oxidoreductase [Marinospirillum insulare]GLR63339.1 twin-arginine translocation pathway signal [Marinospirillum insulare]
MPKKYLPFESVSRRDLLKFSVGAGVVGPLALTAGSVKAVNTKAHIVIVGAGAGGISIANRLTNSLQGAKITIIDTREKHYYQPGWTLVASGVWNQAKTETQVSDWLPKSVNWVKGMVAEYDPDNNQVILETGQSVAYDQLIIASGLQLRYDLIEGMDVGLIGQGKGIGSVYASLDAAAATNTEIKRWISKGSGTGLFNLPPTALKCAGAPLKMTFTTLHRLEDTGRRDDFNVEFMTPSGKLFGVPFYNDFVKQRFSDQGVTRNDFWTLKAVDADAKKATYSVKGGEDQVKDYDFLHVVPPMTAGAALENSPLAFQPGESFTGWMKVDRETLQNPDYPNVWGIGDVMGMPSNKTAASVKMHAKVLEENFLASLQGKPLTAKHNGYTSCPLITGIGKAMLVEFGWDSKLLPSFSFIDPKKESWTVWVMKERMLRPAYYAMLEGKI